MWSWVYHYRQENCKLFSQGKVDWFLPLTAPMHSYRNPTRTNHEQKQKTKKNIFCTLGQAPAFVMRCQGWCYMKASVQKGPGCVIVNRSIMQKHPRTSQSSFLGYMKLSIMVAILNFVLEEIHSLGGKRVRNQGSIQEHFELF